MGERKGYFFLKRRPVLSVTLAAVMGFGIVFNTGGSTYASTLTDLQNQKSQIESKQSNISESIGEKNSQISNIVNQLSALEIEMQRLVSQIADTDNQIKEKQNQIAETEAEIERLRAEIEELKVRIEKRNELLQERARNIQTNGGSVNYLDVFLGAESFADLIDRLSAVTTIVNADKEIMEEQKADKEQLEFNQAEVEKKLKSLTNMLNQLETLKADLKKQNARKQEISKQLEEQKKQTENEKMNLEEEAEVLNAQNAAIQQAIQLEKTRIAEEAARKAREEAERKAREEAERKAREQAAAEAAAQNKNSASTATSQPASKPTSNNTSKPNNNVSSGGSSVGTPAVTSGLFMRPSMGRVSSEFGYRPSLGGYHYGIDLAAPGTVPIVAAADGVVSSSYTSSSYGNVVFVVHRLNGKTYTTVYAHLNSRSVSAGTTVSKGQLLGYMGNTGISFGQHLHFEIHEGAWNGSKSNAVNPRKYINF